jgi:hypothetical protein
MARTLEQTAKSFSALAARIEKTWYAQYASDQSFKKSIGWQSAVLAPADAKNLADEIADRLLKSSSGKPPSEIQTTDYWESLADQCDEIDFANFPQDPNSVARATFEFLIYVQAQLPTKPASVDWDRVKDANLIPKRLGARLRALEARITEIEPRTIAVDKKIKIIEEAHDAAERLPTDLAELQSAMEQVAKNRESTLRDQLSVEESRTRIETALKETLSLRDEAELLVKRCGEAYRITTSAGLAGAFEYRSKSLAWAGWVWVFLLIVSLAAGVFLGKDRFDGLKSLLTGDHPSGLIALNLLFAVLGVAAPVWLAWLSTKNIGQAFRLSEDYAFKASVSKAYEGYRKEAVSLDEELAKRLFSSALNRLDEAPSRLVTRDEHSTPLEALLANSTLKSFFDAVPTAKQSLMQFLADPKAVLGLAAVSGATGVIATKQSSEAPQQTSSSAKPET